MCVRKRRQREKGEPTIGEDGCGRGKRMPDRIRGTSESLPGVKLP